MIGTIERVRRAPCSTEFVVSVVGCALCGGYMLEEVGEWHRTCEPVEAKVAAEARDYILTQNMEALKAEVAYLREAVDSLRAPGVSWPNGTTWSSGNTIITYPASTPFTTYTWQGTPIALKNNDSIRFTYSLPIVPPVTDTS